MSIQRTIILVLIPGLLALGITGCVMHRTVKEGDEVVAQGYVVKAPLIKPVELH